MQDNSLLKERGWEAMSQVLDTEMPVEKKRRRFFFWLLWAGILLLLILGYVYTNSTEHAVNKDDSQFVKIEKTKISQEENSKIQNSPITNKETSITETEKNIVSPQKNNQEKTLSKNAISEEDEFSLNTKVEADEFIENNNETLESDKENKYEEVDEEESIVSIKETNLTTTIDQKSIAEIQKLETEVLPLIHSSKLISPKITEVFTPKSNALALSIGASGVYDLGQNHSGYQGELGLTYSVFSNYFLVSHLGYMKLGESLFSSQGENVALDDLGGAESWNEGLFTEVDLNVINRQFGYIDIGLGRRLGRFVDLSFGMGYFRLLDAKNNTLIITDLPIGNAANYQDFTNEALVIEEQLIPRDYVSTFFNIDVNITPRLNVGFRYRYIGGSVQNSERTSNVYALNQVENPDLHLLNLGLNYKFNLGRF